MKYHGAHLVYVIDGLDGIEACYHFAGIVGIRPHGLTLRQLWRMACGRIRQKRFEMTELAVLVWGLNSLDVESYQYFGSMEESGRGGPVQLSPEMQARVDAEIDRIRRESGETLPQFQGNQ